MTNQAWRIYYNDALAKTELTQSPARVKWARENGHRVMPLIEIPLQDDQHGKLVDWRLRWITGESEFRSIDGFTNT